jgi:hypothetical protein
VPMCCRAFSQQSPDRIAAFDYLVALPRHPRQIAANPAQLDAVQLPSRTGGSDRCVGGPSVTPVDLVQIALACGGSIFSRRHSGAACAMAGSPPQMSV